jgi:glycosyltransferase
MNQRQFDLPLTVPDEWSVPHGDSTLKFTIITTCKNNSSTIENCLSSIAKQTFGGVEHVVVDRQSKDDSPERIYAQRERLSIIFSSADETRFQAWNRGIGQATGDIVGFVDAEDELANPNVLKGVAQAFAHPWVSAVYGDVLCVDAHDSNCVVRQHNYGEFNRARLARGWVPPTTSLFVRKSWYRRIGGFAPKLKLAADYDASLRLFSHRFFKATYLPQPVVRQRQLFPEVRRLVHAFQMPLEELKALRASGVGGWRALAWRNMSKVGYWL